jgi:hypothetical protein
MANFMSRGKNAERILDYLSKRLLHEIKKENSDVECFDWNDLCSVLDEVFAAKKIPFIFIIDEWDCVFREMKEDPEAQKLYLEFLRGLLKDQSYVALAYLTGILPIKKYGKHSALNMFTEISMTDASPIPEFTGFTDEEVCDQGEEGREAEGNAVQQKGIQEMHRQDYCLCQLDDQKGVQKARKKA